MTCKICKKIEESKKRLKLAGTRKLILYKHSYCQYLINIGQSADILYIPILFVSYYQNVRKTGETI